MKNYENIILRPTSTIKEALKIIEAGAMRIALVINENGILLGTITDGDIRRALLSEISLDEPVIDFINIHPVVATIDQTNEEILNLAIFHKIYQIPIVNENNKLVGIEEVDTLIKPPTKTNKVVLMVGGLGTRLRPLTEKTPKPMLKVGSKPILETIIENFKKHGFIDIILSVSYKAEIIKGYFKDGSHLGVNITYIDEEKRMGTAGALSLMKELLSDNFFVMNGDLLTNMNFDNMLNYHVNNNSLATMGVREYDFQVPYGVVNVDGINIKNIEEKPIHSFFVSGGIYILNEKVLDLIPDNQYYDMPTLFEKVIEMNIKTISFPIREYWLDIGRLDEYEKANNEYHEVFNV